MEMNISDQPDGSPNLRYNLSVAFINVILPLKADDSEGRGHVGLALIIVCFFILILLAKRRRPNTKQQRQLPPLVPGCPLLGNIFGIDPSQPHITLTKWGRKYGEIFRIRVLNEDIIVVNDVDLIKEALVTKSTDFAGRPNIFRIDYGFHYAKDVIFGDYSQKWIYMKKIAAQSLRMYGSGVEHVEEVVRDEMVALTAALEARQGEAFDPRVTLMTAVVNALTASVIGKRYDHDDPQMEQYKLTTRLFSESCSPTRGMELDIFPWLRFLNNANFRKLTHARSMLDKLINDEMAAARERYDPNNIRCVLDVLFKNVQGQNKSHDEYAQRNDVTLDDVLTDADVRSIFIDLLVSGTFTTAIALSTFVLLMMKYPEMQRELRLEVSKHIDADRLPTSEDRLKLPLVESFVLELLRYLSHVPLSLPHFTTTDTSLAGYDITKGTKVLLNFWAAHHDPAVWEDPWCFNPKRFLAEDGTLLPPTDRKRKCLIPFGGGKRMCLGETMARERLFLFITSLLHNFNFLPLEGQVAPSPDPRGFDLGLILEPKPFKTCAVPSRGCDA